MIQSDDPIRLSDPDFVNAETFFWTDDELDLLLRCALVFKSKCEYEGLCWEGAKAKYDKIKELVVERYPNKASDIPNRKISPYW